MRCEVGRAFGLRDPVWPPRITCRVEVAAGVLAPVGWPCVGRAGHLSDASLAHSPAPGLLRTGAPPPPLAHGECITVQERVNSADPMCP